MKKIFYLFAILGLSMHSTLLFSQVGINIDTPTEIEDINGTLRVRSLPAIGTTNSIYTTGTNTNSGTSPTQTFSGTTLLLADNNNVLGRSTTTTANLMPNNTTSGFDTSNTSSAMFVIRRYSVTDWPSSGTGFSTGMDVSRWDPIMSNVEFVLPQSATATQPFSGGEHSYRLRGATGDVWRIIGDINGISDGTNYVDVLFINKTYTASDARTN